MASPVYSGAIRAPGRSGRGRYRPMSEIMVTAPLLTVGVPVDLPQTQAPPINEPKEPLVITLNREGVVYVQETSIETDALVPKLQAITGANPDAVIYVRGDKDINYGRVLEVMSLVSSAGFRKVSLVAEAPKGRNATSARPGSSAWR